MSLEEARSVLWLRNNRRPLGELLDEGYLDESRLAWAAEKAYDPKLKQAAGVLLEWVRQNPSATLRPSSPPSHPEPLPTIEARITMEQARATLWPFRLFKGQRMGDLVDTQQLSLKDLVYAIENAWDERVRQAAIALMAIRLNQILKESAPPAGPLKVVSGGRSYSESRQFLWTAIQGMFLGAVSTLCVLLVIQFIWTLISHPSGPDLQKLMSPAGIIALLIILTLTAGARWLVNRLFNLAWKKLDEQVANYRKGQEGEEQVIEILRQNLDGNWTLFRNVILPSRYKADIDGILVGPAGVWALEIKTWTGEYRNIGEHWEYLSGKRWKMLRSSPSRQAQDNAVRLANFFKADGIRQWVTPVVIWANRESPLLVKNPMVAVWTFDRLPDELGNIWQGQTMQESDRVKILEKLTMLCQRTDEEDN